MLAYRHKEAFPWAVPCRHPSSTLVHWRRGSCRMSHRSFHVLYFDCACNGDAVDCSRRGQLKALLQEQFGGFILPSCILYWWHGYKSSWHQRSELQHFISLEICWTDLKVVDPPISEIFRRSCRFLQLFQDLLVNIYVRFVWREPHGFHLVF